MIEEMPRQPWIIIDTVWANKMKTKDKINGLQKNGCGPFSDQNIKQTIQGLIMFAN
jgi:hypothetical protein